MFGYKQGVALFVCMVALSRMFGGFSHNIVPHQHGHTHEGEVTAIWQGLHAALRHESAKAVLPTFVLLILGFAAVALYATYSVRVLGTMAAQDPVGGSLLRRGIIAYRKFR